MTDIPESSPGQGPPPPPPWGYGPPGASGFTTRYGLVRPRNGRYLAGVCAAIGRATNTDPVLWRVLLAVLGFFFGIGILVYVAAWLVIPAEGDSASPVEALLGKGRSSMSPVTVIVLGVTVVVLFGFIVTDAFRAVLLGAAILIGGALLLSRNSGPQAQAAPAGANPPAGPPPWTGPWNAAAGTAQTDPGGYPGPVPGPGPVPRRPCSRRRPGSRARARRGRDRPGRDRPRRRSGRLRTDRRAAARRVPDRRAARCRRDSPAGVRPDAVLPDAPGTPAIVAATAVPPGSLSRPDTGRRLPSAVRAARPLRRLPADPATAARAAQGQAAEAAQGALAAGSRPRSR